MQPPHQRRRDNRAMISRCAYGMWCSGRSVVVLRGHYDPVCSATFVLRCRSRDCSGEVAPGRAGLFGDNPVAARKSELSDGGTDANRQPAKWFRPPSSIAPASAQSYSNICGSLELSQASPL
jgi:hypothetical protein